MQANHLLPLTGIRFFAALWVVCCHFGALFISLLPLLAPFRTVFSLGYLAVPLFFLLSGFILSHNYFSNYSLEQHHKFVSLRFARLWPVHFVTLLLMLVYNGSNYPFERLTGELLMVHSWFHADLGLNYPAWSVSAEWFAYLFVFPLAFLTFKRMSSVVALTGMIVSLTAAASYAPNHLILARGGEIFFLFLAGSALYRIRCLCPLLPSEWIQNFGFVLVCAYLLSGGALPRVIVFAGFAAIVLGLSYQRGLLAQILSKRFVVAGGLASYSLYMTHAVVGKVYALFTEGIGPQPTTIRLLLFVLLVTGLCGAAMGSYRFIEGPANKVLRKLLNTGKQKDSRDAQTVLA